MKGLRKEAARHAWSIPEASTDASNDGSVDMHNPKDGRAGDHAADQHAADRWTQGLLDRISLPKFQLPQLPGVPKTKIAVGDTDRTPAEGSQQ